MFTRLSRVWIEPIYWNSPRSAIRTITICFWQWIIRLKTPMMRNSSKGKVWSSRNWKQERPTIIAVCQYWTKVDYSEIKYRVLKLISQNCRILIRKVPISLYFLDWNSRSICIVSKKYRLCFRRTPTLWENSTILNIRTSNMIKSWPIWRSSSSRSLEAKIERREWNYQTR